MLWRPPSHQVARAVCGLSCLFLFTPFSPAGDDPWADQIVEYIPGSNPASGYTDAATALGPPERFTGEGLFPGAVTIFNSAFGTDELVSLGEGGSLVIQFETPVMDDPDNPYGIDLLIFGNAGFVDVNYPGGITGFPAALFTDAGGVIEVSPDGTAGSWVVVPGITPDDLYPTEGFTDLDDPYATVEGVVPTDFTRPVDPALELSHFSGAVYENLRELYHGSGGGAGIDLGPTGLSAISFVRITNPIGSGVTPEIDALADVKPRRPGDVNYDEVVNVTDLLLLLGQWGELPPGGEPADFTNDRLINVTDLLTLLANWG